MTTLELEVGTDEIMRTKSYHIFLFYPLLFLSHYDDYVTESTEELAVKMRYRF
jgi:hypothetical protein